MRAQKGPIGDGPAYEYVAMVLYTSPDSANFRYRAEIGGLSRNYHAENSRDVSKVTRTLLTLQLVFIVGAICTNACRLRLTDEK